MSNIKNVLRSLRKQNNLTQTQLAEKLGVAKSSISMYESGSRTPDRETLESIADFFNVSMDYLYGRNKIFEGFPSPETTADTTTFQIIGDIAAGYDITAEENWDGEEIEIPNSYIKGDKSNYIVLRVKGDSMYPDYQEGDCVLIRKQSSLDHSGQIGAVLFDGDYATLKRVEYVYGEDWMKLIPLNTAYAPKIIRNEDLERCIVIGVPKLLIRKILG